MREPKPVRIKREKVKTGRHGKISISDATVLAIYRAKGYREDIAREYGCSVQVVTNIRSGRHYSAVTGHVKPASS